MLLIDQQKGMDRYIQKGKSTKGEPECLLELRYVAVLSVELI
jgi:hypothetical protein